MKLTLALGSVAMFAACASTTLTKEDRTSLHEAEALLVRGYRAKDAGTPGAQFDRAAYCAVDAVLRRSDAGMLDDVIVCQAKMK